MLPFHDGAYFSLNRSLSAINEGVVVIPVRSGKSSAIPLMHLILSNRQKGVHCNPCHTKRLYYFRGIGLVPSLVLETRLAASVMHSLNKAVNQLNIN